jgi:hypothetical protein
MNLGEHFSPLSSHLSNPIPNLYVDLLALSLTGSNHPQLFSNSRQFSQDVQSNRQPPAEARCSEKNDQVCA